MAMMGINLCQLVYNFGLASGGYGQEVLATPMPTQAVGVWELVRENPMTWATATVKNAQFPGISGNFWTNVFELTERVCNYSSLFTYLVSPGNTCTRCKATFFIQCHCHGFFAISPVHKSSLAEAALTDIPPGPSGASLWAKA